MNEAVEQRDTQQQASPALEPPGASRTDFEAARSLYEPAGDDHKTEPDRRLNVSRLSGNVLRGLKEYWFLVALGISVLTGCVYMFVFKVTPWDAHRETKNRRLQVEHHVQVGFDLLEREQHRLAKSEFERALSLISTNDSAITGRYVSELFLDFESPDWNAAVGLSLHKRLEERFLENKELRERRHIIKKYLGDLNAAVGLFSEARTHYDEALNLKKDYWGALYNYYLLLYSNSKALELKDEERIKRLVELGGQIVDIDPYDNRGLHALGYSLYEQALTESDKTQRDELLSRAELLSSQALWLKGNEFTVIIDLGEIARHINPQVSLDYHKRAGEILDQPKESQPRNITSAIGIKLHRSDTTINLYKPEQKKALVMFYLALDYLAMHRLDGKKSDLALHRKSLSEAKKLDAENIVMPIYDDQLEVLDTLLSPKS
jgi:tetratricopeptide (TPR) repeat protein